MSQPYPQCCPTGWVVLPGVPLPPHTARLTPRPTPLLSMQVALLRGQSQLGPVQPGSHTHWPMEQRPRSAEGRGGRAEPTHICSPGCPSALEDRACGSRASRARTSPARGKASLPRSPGVAFPLPSPLPPNRLLPTLQPE